MDNAIRVFQTGSDEEPTTIDNCSDENTAVAAANDFFIVGSEHGTVSKYSLSTNSLEEILIRVTSPVRDIAISPDANWAAVASDEMVVNVVNTNDMTRVLYLRQQPRSVKHVSFDQSGTILAVSCSDGYIYFYSISSEEPQLLKRAGGLIKAVDTDAEASSRVSWHPNGSAFAAPTPLRDIQVTSRDDWSEIVSFKDGHTSDISAFAFSPNGALLISTSIDRKLVLWDATTQTILKTYDPARGTILALHWHPSLNLVSYTNNEGEVFIHDSFVPDEYADYLQKNIPRVSGGEDFAIPSRGPPQNNITNGRRRASVDSIDELLSLNGESNAGDDFIDDDDGAGYAEVNTNGKRTNGHLAHTNGISKKNRSYGAWNPEVHESFQPGSTHWEGNRRYLCLNLIGFVWTVNQGDYHSITVEFQDRGFQRDFHFTDAYLFDKACLTENGTLFSCEPRAGEPAQIFYRPHETWTSRSDWRTYLPKGETVTAIALSDSYVVVSTSTGYVRVYTLFGVPFRIYRQKSSSAVTCAAWRDYVLTIGNGAPMASGRTQLVYTLENIQRDETFQSEDIVALSPGSTLQSVFFSDQGDPCIYDDTGVLLVLAHWRRPGQARWIPLLDTKLLDRLADGKKNESYWPVAVAQDRFHCIILKGSSQPYFPRPLLTDFEFQIPITSSTPMDRDDVDSMQTDKTASSVYEQGYIVNTVMATLLADLVDNTRASMAQKNQLAKLEAEADKALLQLLNVECLQGEDRAMRGLEIAGLLTDRGGKMLPAAQKIALRYGREILAEKISELADKRLMGDVDGGHLPLDE